MQDSPWRQPLRMRRFGSRTVLRVHVNGELMTALLCGGRTCLSVRSRWFFGRVSSFSSSSRWWSLWWDDPGPTATMTSSLMHWSRLCDERRSGSHEQHRRANGRQASRLCSRVALDGCIVMHFGDMAGLVLLLAILMIVGLAIAVNMDRGGQHRLREFNRSRSGPEKRTFDLDRYPASLTWADGWAWRRGRVIARRSSPAAGATRVDLALATAQHQRRARRHGRRHQTVRSITQDRVRRANVAHVRPRSRRTDSP